MLFWLHHQLVGVRDLFIDQNAATMLASDHFFVQTRFELGLRSDFVVATAACVALNRDDREAVAIRFADFIVGF